MVYSRHARDIPIGDFRSVVARAPRRSRASTRRSTNLAAFASNPGDVKPVGSGVSEMRIDYGPGDRVYFTRRGRLMIVLLCGGDKRTQDVDIERAIEIAADWDY